MAETITGVTFSTPYLWNALAGMFTVMVVTALSPFRVTTSGAQVTVMPCAVFFIILLKQLQLVRRADAAITARLMFKNFLIIS